MVGNKIDESEFILKYIQPGTKLSVQCYFLYKAGQGFKNQERHKHVVLFNTSHYPLEAFYKPINFYFDITKTETNDGHSTS